MFNHKYISIKVIVDRIKRGKMYKELPFESAIDYAVQAYRLMAAEKAEITMPAKIEINNNKGILPPDMERIIQTVKIDSCFKYLCPMRFATDNFHSVLHCTNSPDLKCVTEYTYSLNNNFIITNFKEGWVFMAYKALPTDEECLLMIPDNVNVQLAIEYYIKSRYLDDLGSDDRVVMRQQEKDDQEYCWYIGKAQAAMTAMTMDEYESFANSMSKFFDTEDYYQTFLRNLGTRELIRNQSHYG